MIMTPTHTDTPIRRSEVGSFRTPLQTPVINDDEAERRRRRTILETSTTSTFEESETLKDCLQIYHDNKINKENAWSVSLIDTLGSLLDKHHKSLNNFKVAGSSLEASSKVYGLRVDSIHSDVVRMTSDLNKRKIVRENDNYNDDGDENGAAGNNAEGNSAEPSEQVPAAKRKKRVRKIVSTITKNKETINGKLDTVPFMDSTFAKLNSTVGSINSSNRLLQNILPSIDSELILRSNVLFWDSQIYKPQAYSEDYDFSICRTINATLLTKYNLNNAVIRSTHTGYKITDAPAGDDEPDDRPDSPDNMADSCQPSMAFDLNADVEPIVPDTQNFMDVDIDAFDNLTAEDHVAINNCRGLRRAPVVLEDMRPVDSTIHEYSYRALDKIHRYWAGPSHWKFKKSRSTFSAVHDCKQQNPRKKGRRPIKYQKKYIDFSIPNDEMFHNVDEKRKLRKVNMVKRFDAKKLKLPTDLQIDRNIFEILKNAPNIQVYDVSEPITTDHIPDSTYDYDNPVDKEYCSNIPNDDYAETESLIPDSQTNDEEEPVNQTVLQIPTDFEHAPDKVAKVVVPFSKRAKVIDMKQLKKCCMEQIIKQINDPNKENMTIPETVENEIYKGGFGTFSEVYKALPSNLTSTMAENLSPSIAFYSILHLANESKLRLVQQDDLKDFKIRQIDEGFDKN